MATLWVNLIIVFLLSFYARYFSVRNQSLESSVPIKPNKIMAFGALLCLVIVSGLRSNIGDTYFYKHSYESNDFTWDYIISEKDIGFGLLQMILKNYISKDPQVMIFTTALITNLLIWLVLYKYSRLIELSLYVYITGGLFLVSMNGIRQVLAAAIAFIAIRFLIHGNFLKYTLVILFASLFHQSVLILIPIYFLVRFKAWSKTTISLILLSIVIVIGFEQFTKVLFSAIGDTQYGHYKDFSEGGANILRVMVGATPLSIAYIGRGRLRELFPNSDYIINMAVLGWTFMFISTQNWIFARFSIYFELYLLIVISWIVKLFREKDEKIIYYGIIICYFAYYFFENIINLNIIYRSDYLM